MKFALLTACILGALGLAQAGKSDKVSDTEWKQPSLTLEKFYFVHPNDRHNPTAEICGTASLAHVNDMVVIVTDAGTQMESQYQTKPGPNNQFCLMVKTFSGNAEAFIWRFGSQAGFPTVKTSIPTR